MRVVLLALLVVAAAPVVADGSPSPEDQDRPSQAPPRPAPDFLFGRPDGSLTVRGSWFFSRAGSDWFDFVTEHLTLDDGDFNLPAIGVDVGITLTNSADLLIGFDYGQATRASEYRDFVDNFRLPIEQTTRLREFNISASLKYALVERGRDVGNFAWVPRPIVPFVGAGAGVLRFDVRQFGDFVDFVDNSIFTDAFVASGWTPSAHVLGGVDMRVFRRLFLTVEGRYLWAAGDLGSTWIDFDPIDLTGARLSAGINVVF
jgi:hypothetical protein